MSNKDTKKHIEHHKPKPSPPPKPSEPPPKRGVPERRTGYKEIPLKDIPVKKKK